MNEAEGLHQLFQRIGRQFAEIIDKDRSAAYKFLRREIAANMATIVSADEVGNLKEWIVALQKIEEGMGGNEAEDLEYPLDKIAKMLNDSGAN